MILFQQKTWTRQKQPTLNIKLLQVSVLQSSVHLEVSKEMYKHHNTSQNCLLKPL